MHVVVDNGVHVMNLLGRGGHAGRGAHGWRGAGGPLVANHLMGALGVARGLARWGRWGWWPRHHFVVDDGVNVLDDLRRGGWCARWRARWGWGWSPVMAVALLG